MDMNKVAMGNRIHISFFGMRNAGKSSVINAITSQNVSVVSEILGTTTDLVKKSMELLPLGPVLMIDTPGIDDEGELGALRVERTKSALSHTDIAVLVVDKTKGMQELDRKLIELFQKRNLPYLIAYNKSDLCDEAMPGFEDGISISAETGYQIEQLKIRLGEIGRVRNEKKIVGDLLKKNDMVVLVIPIDEGAPKNRLIMPQQMVIRDVLDVHGIPVCCRLEELHSILEEYENKIKLVITDSQVFEEVNAMVPKHIYLTSFSILMARYKGTLDFQVKAAQGMKDLKEGDIVLISEGCTHHRQCNDIGRVKIPRWINQYVGTDLIYEFTSGGEFPANLGKYRMVIHCGGCMLNEQEMKSRMKQVKKSGILMVNYGMAIAQVHGILARSMEFFL